MSLIKLEDGITHLNLNYKVSSINNRKDALLWGIEKAECKAIKVLSIDLDDFESWIETYREGDASREIVVNYDFDRSIIDSEDYLYIDSEKHTWDDGYTSLVNYDVYFFDTQTNTLYYFHNNI